MSNIAIKGNASGTGTFTIEAPNSNTDRTLVLPDEAGTVLTSGGAIDVNASAPADSLVIDASGNVGIGTTSPGAKLHTSVSSGGNKIIIQNTAASQQSVLQINTDSTTPGQCQIYMGKTSAPTNGQIGYDPGSDYLYFYVSNVEKARFNSGTGLLIGTTNNSPAESASVNGIRLGYSGGIQAGKAGSEVMRLNRNTNDGRIIGLAGQSSVRGEIAVSGTTIQYTSFSDHRLKENVQSISDSIGLVKMLNPVNFDWIETSQNVNGFLAHEVQTVVPEAVTGTHNEVEVWKEGDELPEGVSVGDNKLDEDGNTIPVYQGIDQSKLVPLLTGALQEAIAKIETLETTVADLQTRVTALEATP